MPSNILFSGSKTFLVGEYSVLFGGSAVVLVTPPEFQLTVEEGNADLSGINVGSPADLFYKSHDFRAMAMKFRDPHGGLGGLGASSAQFAMLYRLYLELTGKDFDVALFLNEYKKLSRQSGGIAPSGADCVAQYFNHGVFFDSATYAVEMIHWNFPRLDFMIFRTGYKVVTHLHLQTLTSIAIGELQNAVLNVKKSFANVDEASLTSNVQTFFNLLKKKGLVMDQIIKIIDRLLTMDGVMAAKGCGAMGADTILVIFEKSARQILISKARDLGLQLVYAVEN